ncbi:MAG: DMT family transporter [Acidiferrobacterales bacterium]|nr:DMT family transporter [Acidiferrobacterales bacterium]
MNRRIINNLSQNVQGIVCLIFALLCLTVSDAIIKWLSSTYALHEITLIRALFALTMVVVFAKYFGDLSRVRTRRLGLHLIRGFMLVLANIFFFLGLSVMPLATTVALFYCAPFFICILARVILHEPVGLPRWMAIAAGMLGVVVIAQPGGTDFSWSVFLPVGAAFTYSLMVMMTRKLAISDSAESMSFYIQACFLIFSLLSGLLIGDGRFNTFDHPTLDFLLRAWLWPSLKDFQILLICGAASAAGTYLLSQSYRIAQASVVAPFEYVSLPFAIAVGFIVWGDLPGLSDYIGSALIVCSGLVVVYFEARLRRMAKT